MPEARGRFSTNIGCPSVRDTPSAMSRAITSVAAPGPVGTISLIGRLGQVWALALPLNAIYAQQSAMRKKPVTVRTRAIPFGGYSAACNDGGRMVSTPSAAVAEIVVRTM